MISYWNTPLGQMPVLEVDGKELLKAQRFSDTLGGNLAELTKLLTTTKSKRYLGSLEKRLGKNKDGKGWFVGDKITFADIQVFWLLHDQYPTVFGGRAGDVDYLKEYKLLHGFVERFKAEPKVSEWLAKRPVTPF
ncbi:S-crystallin SL11 [Holothuria leucospilota]|uniref:S-crystallin SL11 n=1 Tax=Holothuria leucospilota TaxID=206669 RepID=A0A9Q0YFU7_HOLLE|nr:S-crystallin SL11 [Holothuria leucospilota]